MSETKIKYTMAKIDNKEIVNVVYMKKATK